MRGLEHVRAKIDAGFTWARTQGGEARESLSTGDLHAVASAWHNAREGNSSNLLIMGNDGYFYTSEVRETRVFVYKNPDRRSRHSVLNYTLKDGQIISVDMEDTKGKREIVWQDGKMFSRPLGLGNNPLTEIEPESVKSLVDELPRPGSRWVRERRQRGRDDQVWSWGPNW